jgi:hypothetical protein
LLALLPLLRAVLTLLRGLLTLRLALLTLRLALLALRLAFLALLFFLLVLLPLTLLRAFPLPPRCSFAIVHSIFGCVGECARPNEWRRAGVPNRI